MRDANLNFGTIDFASTNLGALGALRFPDAVDLGVAGRDIGVGRPLCLEFSIETDLAATGAHTVYFGAVFASSSTVTSANINTGQTTTIPMGFSPVIGDNIGGFVCAQGKAGLKVYCTVPPFPTYDLTAAADAQRDTPFRYLLAAAWNFPVTVGTINAGTVSARLVEWAGAWKPYAVGADLH